MAAIGFVVDDVTHPESLQWAYDPALNTDPDGDSDGMIINMHEAVRRPVPPRVAPGALDSSRSRQNPQRSCLSGKRVPTPARQLLCVPHHPQPLIPKAPLSKFCGVRPAPSR